LAIPTPTRPPKYLHAAPGDVHHFAHIRVTTTPCVYYFQRILGATLSRLPSRTRLTRHRNFGYTNALTTAKLSARSSRRCSSVSASPRGQRSLPSTSSNGSWVPPSHASPPEPDSHDYMAALTCVTRGLRHHSNYNNGFLPFPYAQPSTNIDKTTRQS
jgi:hypothetical protein